MTAEQAIAEIESLIAGMDDDDSNACAPIQNVIDRFRNPEAVETEAQARTAASARGWVEGGGYVYHRDHFGSWKEAVSWSGEEGHEDHPLYDSWRECCEGEGIDMAAEGV
jgi:hypothetical protein